MNIGEIARRAGVARGTVSYHRHIALVNRSAELVAAGHAPATPPPHRLYSPPVSLRSSTGPAPGR